MPFIPFGDNYPYGESPYYKDDGTIVASNKLHYYALKKLFPINQGRANSSLGGDFDNDLDIEGKYLDNAYFQGMVLEREIFPDTAQLGDTTASYERLFDTTSMTDVFQKYDDLTDKDRKMNPYQLVTDASRYGYDSSIFEGISQMFVVSYNPVVATHLPGQLWNRGHAWTFYMDSTGSTSPSDRTDLMQYINQQAPAFTLPVYNFA